MTIKRVAPNEIATVVTYLDMRERPAAGASIESRLRLKQWRDVDLDRYRALFRRVGQPWLWFSRLVLDDEALARIIRDPGVSVFAVEDGDESEVGIIELDHRRPRECELAYFGLVPQFAGQGHGRWLMARALELAWRPDTARVHVHSCTLDHPAALGFYRRSGFEPRGRALETFPDPRLAGILSRDAAPHVPIIEI